MSEGRTRAGMWSCMNYKLRMLFLDVGDLLTDAIFKPTAVISKGRWSMDRCWGPHAGYPRSKRAEATHGIRGLVW